jgi:hypothetical protein
MDYLPHPRVQQDAIQVPMLLGCTGYDHLSFEGFPARCGWDLTKMLKAELDGKEPSTAAAFIQQWLYFGVIATAFSVAGIPFILSEFLLAQDGLTIARYLAHAPRSDRQRIRAVIRSLERHDSPVAPDQLHAPGKPLPLFVTGKPLVAGLQNLEAKERSASEEQRGEGFGRINRAVDTALRVIRPLSEAISTAGGDGNHDQHDLLRAILPGEIELSIVLLMETIKYKMVEIYGLRLNLRPQASEWLFSRMGDFGWCRAFLLDLLHRYGMRFIYYSYLLGDIPGDGLDHSKCQGRRCLANNIDQGTYVTKHINPELVFRPTWWEPHSAVVIRVHRAWYEKRGQACGCNHIGPDISEVQNILHRGGIPLISLRTPTFFDRTSSLLNIQLDVVEWEPSIPYCAISHV